MQYCGYIYTKKCRLSENHIQLGILHFIWQPELWLEIRVNQLGNWK